MHPYPPTELRCPRCGLTFIATHPNWSGSLGFVICPRCWFSCPSLPLPPRPPLYSWEVVRYAYPEPRWPKTPGPRTRRFLTAVLISAGGMLLVLAAIFAGVGIDSSTGNFHQSVGGKVFFGNQPLSGSEVRLDWPGHWTSTVTDGNGSFMFRNLASGEYSLTFLLQGYETTNMTIFLTKFFSLPEGNITHLVVNMVPGDSKLTREYSYSLFPDSETYIAIVFSAAIIEAVGGAVALAGGLSYYWTGRPPRGVVGGAGAFLSPFFPLAVGVGGLYSLVFAPSLGLALAASALGFIGTVGLLMSHRPL